MVPGHATSSMSPFPKRTPGDAAQKPYFCARCLRPQISFRLSCPDCGACNSLESRAGTVSEDDSRPVPLDEIGPISLQRVKSNILQLDDLLGEGFVQGSSLLLAGSPGAGKSTLVI